MPMRAPNNMITGTTTYGEHSQVVLDVQINDKVAVTSVDALNFKRLCPVFLPKGPTNRVFKVAGSGTVGTFLNTFGHPHTGRYGFPGTAAYEAVLNGWTTYIVNLRPDDATYANVITNFVVEPVERVFAVQPPGARPYDYHRISTFNTVDDIPDSIKNTPGVVIGAYPSYDVGFKDSSMSNLYDDGEFRDQLEMLCQQAVPKVDTAKYDASYRYSLPVTGFVYQGAGEYANGFTVSISDTSESLVEEGNIYPLFKLSLLEGSSAIYNGLTALTRLQSDGLPVAPDDIFDRYTDYYFGAYLSEAKYLNKITELVINAADMSIVSLREALAIAVPEMDVDNPLSSDFNQIVLNAELHKQEFTKTSTALYGDHALSTFKFLHTPIATSASAFNYVYSNGVHKLTNGSYGCVNEIIKTDGFDWNATVAVIEDPSGGEEMLTVYNSPTLQNNIKIKLSDDKYEVTYIKPFIQMYLDFFNCEITQEICDPAIVGACIILDPDYPMEIKQAAERFTNCPSGFQSTVKRPDITFIATPPASYKNSQEIAEWSRQFMTENRNLYKVSGRTVFSDITTNRPSMLPAIFSFDKTLLPHLLKVNGKSYSAEPSAVYTNLIKDRWVGLPSGPDEKNLFADTCLNYYAYYDSLNAYALDDDVTNMPNVESSVKRLINNIMFNEVITRTYLFIRENKISNANPVEWNRLEQAILQKINEFQPAFTSLNVRIGYDITSPADVAKGIPSCFLTASFDGISRSFKMVAEVVPNETE